jgi:hypothetical protein
MSPQVTSFFSDWPHQSLFSFQEDRHIFDRLADNIFDIFQLYSGLISGLNNYLVVPTINKCRFKRHRPAQGCLIDLSF